MADTNWKVKLQKKLPLVLTGRLLPVSVLLVITILYSRQLSYADYGRFQTVWVLNSVAGTILSFGLPAVLLATPAGMFRQYLWAFRSRIYVAAGIILSVAMTIIWLGTPHESIQVSLTISLLIILQTACIIAETMLIKNGQFRTYVAINIIYPIAFLCVHLYFLYTPFRLLQLVSFLSVLCFIKLMALLLAQRKRVAGANTETTVASQLPATWLFTGLNEVIGIVTRWLDKIFLLYLLTPADFAVFFNGAFEIPLFAVLISAVEQVMLTNISENLPDRQEAKSIFRESFKLLSLVAFPVFFFFLFAHNETYAFLFSNKYDKSIPVFVVSIFIIPLRITHYGVLLQCYGRANKLFAGSVMDIILSLALMIIFYPWLGTPGVVLALVVSTYLQIGYYLYHSAKAVGGTVYELVPFVYLLKFFVALGVVYFLLSLTKPYLPTLAFLVGLFLLSSLIVLAGVYQYYTSHAKNIRQL